MPLSQTAETGFAASSTYDAKRPSYPPEAATQFLEVLKVLNEANAPVLDLAAGTGKFTELLASRPENFSITAVEPHAGMREQLAGKNIKNVKVLEGLADNMSAVEDGSVAAVIAAQAFHWFANMDALKEIYRVLRPTGVFGMIWNVEDYNAPKEWDIHGGWETVMRQVMWDLDDGLPRFRNEKWKQVFDEQSKSDPISLLTGADPLFGLPIGEASMNTVEWMSKEAILERFKTYSQVANLQGEKLENFERTFWNAMDDSQTEVDAHGKVAVHIKVIWAWADKIPGEPLQKGGRPDQ